MTMTSTSIRVVDTGNDAAKGSEKPSHWVDDNGTSFKNPWASWREHDWRDQLYIVFGHSKNCPTPPDNMSSLIPARRPTWDVGDEGAAMIKATWMGHASFFVEFPARSSESGTVKTSRGVRIMFDPIFSERCSPVNWAGFKRITPPACAFEELPEIDVVVISHDHYDHLDQPTIKKFASLKRVPHFFITLGNKELLMSMGVPKDHCHVLDWWQSRRIEVMLPVESGTTKAPAIIDLFCTPSQHNVGRNFMDRFYHAKSLWSSWVARETLSNTQLAPKSAFFGGDTGYRAVLDGQDQEKVPVCEAFKKIGAQFGPIDLAMIPIGAYSPRRYMSPIHCSPDDSILLFKDIKAKLAVGMHWGTFVLTTEPIMDPPKKLDEACSKYGVASDSFITTEIGETRLY